MNRKVETTLRLSHDKPFILSHVWWDLFHMWRILLLGRIECCTAELMGMVRPYVRVHAVDIHTGRYIRSRKRPPACPISTRSHGLYLFLFHSISLSLNPLYIRISQFITHRPFHCLCITWHHYTQCFCLYNSPYAVRDSSDCPVWGQDLLLDAKYRYLPHLPCSAMLSYAVLCYAILCCAMLCSALLCTVL